MMWFRIRDICLAVPLLVLSTPLMACIACLLWLSQGKVWFFQLRPGLNEHPFTLIKFSTLYDAAPGQDEAENQQARLTPVGKYLRRWSLDELPQLINVLKGEMSLVGPRPLLMEYLPLYAPADRIRHQVRPGITGWAQVKGRNQLSFKARFELDRWYVEHRSLWLDFRIMLLTLLKVFQRAGVYADSQQTSPRFDGNN